MVVSVRAMAMLVLLMLTGACDVIETPQVQYVALLAPFEGRDHEIGYQSFYAIRLALQETGQDEIALLAVDDGGTVNQAIERMQALSSDTRVLVVLTAGIIASDPLVQQVADDLPVVTAGYWDAEPASINSFIMTSDQILEALAASNAIGLRATTSSFSRLEDVSETVVYTAASLPNADFVERYLAVDRFVPEPTLIAVKAYESANYLLSLLDIHRSRVELTARLRDEFPNGYYSDADLFTYRFDEAGELMTVDRSVEQR